ncbi:DNA/RNA-binding protein Alba 2, putative [Plasmodium knowlesi strain H]|uniref:DNA/RNA-binding protein Alba 2, putative n=3 Tax=Plasmodium knowlesi TaxID=5850 RepID=A0A5K1UVR8_PLAKH|nr:DNA/RNA-binding protein Alba 2, putative [Plasmodium knowlesi strain H]OTN66236.1 putative ALBA-like protein [Plasmodium knowlesi]CAA9989873.1 DNA/RNA-binding protein Alba 2, putative [Plasmodium knowlesi strain H]SBO24432.1 DNA/RNA-binding protein Alba 2, putative [Plasmodium knowlesi strain H]SBO26572.1 DNA/RNA-binding protein Alba 2, putative [Plasmodium knowlesi strain H]VVS79347.1 DNA/RNA-binding protein Alba 2, putative [Plasmodium knowlesi strain H]|eukprot:XP_002259889.1 ALBA homolog, putative [Plasmodium knowlesi strain H]
MPGSTKSDTKLDNEIRVSYKSDALDYVYKAVVLFETHDDVILSGVGKAITSVVNVAEMVKRRAKGLHQCTKVYEKEHIIKKEDPLAAKKEDKEEEEEEKKPGEEPEEGEENDKNKETENRTIEFRTTVPCIKIILTKNDTNVDKKEIGYQAPIDDKDVNVMTADQILKEKSYRRKYRTGRGGDRFRSSYRRNYYETPMWNNRRFEKKN